MPGASSIWLWMLGQIIAHCLTDQDTDDPAQAEPLLDQVDGEIEQFTADGVYEVVLQISGKVRGRRSV